MECKKINTKGMTKEDPELHSSPKTCLLLI